MKIFPQNGLVVKIEGQWEREWFFSLSGQLQPKHLFLVCVDQWKVFFFHHPKAQVVIYSDTLSMENLQKFTSLNCNITIDHLGLQARSKGTAIEKWDIEKYKTSSYFYSHSTDALRLLILQQKGGVYFDTDVIFFSPVTKLRNVAGMETAFVIFEDEGPKNSIALDGHGLNGAVLIFDANNSFINTCIDNFVEEYNPIWWPCVGPELLTKVWKRDFYSSVSITALPSKSFYPSDFRMWHMPLILFNKDIQELESSEFDLRLHNLYNTSFAYHFWNHASKDFVAPPKSIFRHVLNDFCLFCDEVVS